MREETNDLSIFKGFGEDAKSRRRELSTGVFARYLPRRFCCFEGFVPCAHCAGVRQCSDIQTATSFGYDGRQKFEKF